MNRLRQSTDGSSSLREKAKGVAEKERAVQREVDRSDQESEGKQNEKKAGDMQAGARVYPVPPLPKQHLRKPGHEADLDLSPMYDAPNYKGSDKLLNMAALITGGDSGIGRSVAVLFAREGADIGLAYLDEHDDAKETKRAVEKEGRRCILLPGDVADPDYCRSAVDKVVTEFGKIDVLVNNAAFQEHVTTRGDRPSLCVSRRSELLELHHRRGAADHRRVFRRVDYSNSRACHACSARAVS
jgi:hypothetical protein